MVSFEEAEIEKSSIEFFELVKEKAKTPYEKMTIIGDSIEKDIITPNKIGIKTIYFGKENCEKATKSISSFKELLK